MSNSEKYPDPTAEAAIRNFMREERKKKEKEAYHEPSTEKKTRKKPKK